MKPFLLSFLFLLSITLMNAQAFLNGDFETNLEGTCNFNMGNLGFSGSMAFTTAFGLGAEMDIQTGGCGYGTPFSGNWFISLANSGLNPDAISMQLNQPLVAGNSYTFYYHDQANTQFTNSAPLLIGLSTVQNSFGTQIFTAQPVVNAWTQRTVTFVAPNNGQFITIQSSPGITNWNFVDNFYFDECATDDIDLAVTGCLGDTVTLDATTPGATYVWPDGSSGSTFQVNASGVYILEITVNGCTFNMVYTVNMIAVEADLGPDVTICQNQSVTLDAGIAGLNYTWQDGSTAQTFSASSPGTYSVQVSLGNCVDNDEIEVFVNLLPVFDLGPDQTICPGNTATLDATVNGASYEWQNGSTQATFTANTAGLYTVEVTLNQCAATDQVTISYHPNEDTNGNFSTCEGEDFVLADGSIVTTSGSYTVNFNSAVTGCPVIATANVVFNPHTFSNVVVETCPGQPVILPDGTSVTVSGNYTTVLPSPVTGCPHTTNTHVTIFQPFTVALFADICEDEEFELPDGNLVSSTGSYPVLFQTVNGCDSIVTTNLTVWPLPDMDFSYEPEKLNLLDPTAQFNSLASNVAQLEWDFAELGTSDIADPEFTFPFDLPGFYEVCLLGTSDFGCQSTICKTVEVFSELNFWCPTAFTPNSDEKNEVFKPVVNGHRENDYLFEVFDRWGQKVFSTTDPDMGWTGNHTGGDFFVQNDIYYWHAKVQPLGVDNRQIFTGHVMIIR